MKNEMGIVDAPEGPGGEVGGGGLHHQGAVGGQAGFEVTADLPAQVRQQAGQLKGLDSGGEVAARGLAPVRLGADPGRPDGGLEAGLAEALEAPRLASAVRLELEVLWLSLTGWFRKPKPDAKGRKPTPPQPVKLRLTERTEDGAFKPLMLDAYPAHEELWKATLDGLVARLEKHGVARDAVRLGEPMETEPPADVETEPPAEAEIASHQLMLRAGMVRQSSAGIYSWLPLGYRVLRRIEQIVHEAGQAADFVVDRVAIGVQHQRRERIPLRISIVGPDRGAPQVFDEVLDLDVGKVTKLLSSEREFEWIARQLDRPIADAVRALEILHDFHVIHRDMKVV